MSGWDTAIVMLAGPIKHWWDENWGTPAHLRYVEWRDWVSAALVETGYLVYRPHEAFKGMWDERAQSVNDMALRIADVVLNLTPPGVPSMGTDGEILSATSHGDLIVNAPPTENFDEGIRDLLARLEALNVRRTAIMQESVRASLLIDEQTKSAFGEFLSNSEGQVLRVHYYARQGHIQVEDVSEISLSQDTCKVVTVAGESFFLQVDEIQKIETLDRQLA